MKLAFHRFNPATLLRFAAVMACGCVFGSAMAQDQARLEVEELTTALKATQKQLARSEKERQALLEAATKAKVESADLRKAFTELSLRLEARGESLNAEGRSLEERLLKAVRNYDLSQSEVEQLAAQLLRLSEAAMTSQDVPSEATAKLLTAEVEVALALVTSIESRLAPAASVDGFASGRVVSLEPSIGLVVMNIGKKSGTLVGMPLEVLRDGRQVAIATVVDVRDEISGAVLSELVSTTGSVKIGDMVRPRPQAL